MTHGDASSNEMQRLLHRLMSADGLELDGHTADRLLSGGSSVDDAPPAFRRVAHVLTVAAAAGATAEEPERGSEAAAWIAEEIRRDRTSAPRRLSMQRKRRIAQFAAASVVSSMSLFGGLAVVGALPGAAQGIAADMLDSVGVTVPDPNSHAGTHPDERGQSSSAGDDAESNGKGSTISDIARTTTATGVDKGAEVSTAASDGKSKAGQQGAAANSGDAPPVSVPNGGGTGTADTANGGNSTAGTANADTHSEGHSSAGSENATTGPSHKP